MFGGELEAINIGGDNYKFRLTTYIDCSRVSGMPSTESFQVYNSSNALVKNITLSIVLRDTLPVIQNACANSAAGTCVGRVVLEGTDALPLITGGYTLAYGSCCRNSNITNIISPGGTGQVYVLKLPGGELVNSGNSAPVFNSLPPSEICTNMPMSVDFKATDTDGDLLKYRLANPYGDLNGGNATTPPIANVSFSAPYTAIDPLNAGIQIDSLTGEITGTPKNIGLFVIGVVVEEYRGGKLIGTKIRDFTYTIVACAPAMTANNPLVSSCVNSPVQFDYTFSGQLKPGTTPHWNFGDPASGANNNSTLKNTTHQYSAVGTYYAAVDMKDFCGNTLRDTVRIDIIETRPNVADPGLHCKGDQITLTSSDIGCSQMTWYNDSTSTAAIHTGCSYTFTLSDSNCVYFEPFVDPATYTVGANGFQGWGTDATNTATFDALLPLTIEGFSLNGDQFWSGCIPFSAEFTVEKNGIVVCGPITKTINCDGTTANAVADINFNVPFGTGYSLKVTGATLKPTTGASIVNKIGVITFTNSGPFYNIKMHSDQKCPVRSKLCVKSVCPCPDTTLKFPAPICSSANFDLSTLKTATTSLGTWSIVSAPAGSNPAKLTGTKFNSSNNGDSGQYSLMYTVAGGPYPLCADSNVRVITVNQKDTAKIKLNQGPFCIVGGTKTLLLESISNAGTWSGTGISNSAAGLFDPNAAGNGMKVISFTTNGVCPVVDTVHITVEAKKISNITTADTIVCQNSSAFNIRLSSNSSSGGIWLNGLNAATNNFNPTAAGPSKIYYAVQGLGVACSAVDSLNITVNTNANATLTTPTITNFCLGDTGVTAVPTVLPATGNWWSVPAGAVNTSGKYNPAAAIVGATKVYYGISGMCGDTNFVTFTLHPTKNPSITKFGPLCEIAKNVVMKSVDAGSWTVDGAASDGNFLAQNYSIGKHEVILSIKDFCPLADTINVEIKKNPTTNFSADTLGGCIPLLVTFSDLSDSTALSSKWYIQKNFSTIDSLSTLLATNYNFEIPGCYDVILKNNYAYGCSSLLQLPNQICAGGLPIADFEFLDLPKNIQDPTVNLENKSMYADTYFWKMPEGNPDTSSIINPYTRYTTFVQDTFPVTLLASNQWCADSITKNLIIYDIFGVNVPNAFTPNNDGRNETFYPTGRNITDENYDFMVFNRWGELIYQSNTPLAAWNGKKFNTMEECQIDVYVWKLIVKNTFTNKKEEHAGTVTLVR